MSPLVVILLFVALSSAEAQLAKSSPSGVVLPFDLALYTPAELRIFGARCDSEIAAALTRGDSNSAAGWARVRSVIAIRLASLEQPREEGVRRGRSKTLKAQKEAEAKIDPTPSPRVVVTPSSQLDELIRQYRRLQRNN